MMNQPLNKVLNNAGWIIMCRLAQSVIALFISTISARYLGPSNYGLISYAASIVAFVAPLARLGINNILVEEIISGPDREGQILGTTFVMCISSSLLCMLGCISFVAIADPGETDAIIVCALYSTLLIFQMTEMIQYWYQAKLLSKYTSITSLVSYAIVAVYKLVLLTRGTGIYWFAISYTFDALINSAVLLVVYKKLGGQKLSFSFSLGKHLLSKGKYYIVSNMMVTLFSQTDKIMIKMMVGNADNGYYSAAITCAGVTSFVFNAIIDSFRPDIYSSKKLNQKLFEKKISVLYAIMIYMGLAQSIVFTIIAKPLVMILYGESYLPAIPLLQTITWYTAFSYMGNVRNIWMLAEQKQRYLWIINLSGAVLNIIGNSILIPVMDALGAAIASVTTQFFTNFIMCIIFKPIRPTARLILNGMHPRLLTDLVNKFIRKEYLS